MNEEDVERNYEQSFVSLKPKLDRAIQYVEEKYYLDKKITSSNRLRFVLDEGNYMKGTIIKDDTITRQLKETIIYNISFEKSSRCQDRHIFDLVRFKLKNKGQNYQYYYVFEFCPLQQEMVDSPNFKSIPLNTRWSLEIEKN